MRLGIAAIGTEVTEGRIANTNAAWIAKRFLRLGIETAVHVAAPDDAAEIRRALEYAASRADLVIVTGGLGPTLDDITRDVAALLAGVPLEEDEPSLRFIEGIFAALGRSMSPNNRRQALFPRGARVMPNTCGTAPGFEMTISGARFFFVPGVPRESERMLEGDVVPAIEAELARSGAGTVRVRRLNSFGLPESKVDALLAPHFAARDPELAFNISRGVVQVYLTARGADGAACEAKLAAGAARVREVLGAHVFSEGECELEQALAAELSERGLTVGLAESCTGGLAASRLTRVPGVSSVFLGGIVAYSNAAKRSILGVDPALIERHGAVSRECALAMAHGARRALGCAWAASITGIAGPDGGSAGKPVGLVHIAVAGPDLERSREVRLGGERTWIQEIAALGALDQLRRAILGLPGA